MNILAVIGSPRKGNCFDVAQKIEKKLKKLGEVNFEYLFLKKSNLEICLGCFTCISKGEKNCPLKDEREKIESQILNADGVIFISPNYYCNITSIMKNFIDRFAYCGHRPRFFNQYAMVICTSAGPGGLKQSINSLSVIKSAGFNLVHKIGIMVPPYSVAEKFKENENMKIEKAALIFYKAITHKIPIKPKLTDIMKFRAVRSFLLYKKDYLRCDYEYWKNKGWLSENKYYTDIQVGVLKNIIGILIEKICIFYYKHMLLKGIN